MFSAWFSEIFLLCFRQHKPRNHQRAAESPAKWWSEEEKFVNSKSKYGCGGKMGNKKSFRFIPTGGYYEYFNIWLTLTCQSKDSSNVSFMTNGYGIQNLYSHFICMILLSQPGGGVLLLHNISYKDIFLFTFLPFVSFKDFF